MYTQICMKKVFYKPFFENPNNNIELMEKSLIRSILKNSINWNFRESLRKHFRWICFSKMYSLASDCFMYVKLIHWAFSVRFFEIFKVMLFFTEHFCDRLLVTFPRNYSTVAKVFCSVDWFVPFYLDKHYNFVENEILCWFL